MQKIYESDPWLEPWKDAIEARHSGIVNSWEKYSQANAHLYYGLHKEKDSWVLREWAPNATKVYLIGDCNNWKRSPAFALKRQLGAASAAYVLQPRLFVQTLD